ncbi:ribosome hibernation-promoting factor, HPF/YfiA family [Pelomicrobium methylotrophicum]|uniref:Ribosome-associated translation inhibitor RaiA n=1 Tax=Pelomicrobium methylotrophicum TaxID=2602750 RepID=A0A5C7ERS7_9PROT|nr:ribosome-associated translation inhibitor RaiA [Pelomicrobium methylotrophicum]TXF10955.1 ribosome-associated translation inhibitor RaiA [Pelomicrobium methylotrophicum]
MQIDIQARDFTLTEGLRAHVERRLRFALTRYRDCVRRITVRLADVNGPRRGADKRCLLQLRLNGLPDIIVEDIEADLYVAVDRAVSRARRTVERYQQRRRNPLNHPFQQGSDDWV